MFKKLVKVYHLKQFEYLKGSVLQNKKDESGIINLIFSKQGTNYSTTESRHAVYKLNLEFINNFGILSG